MKPIPDIDQLNASSWMLFSDMEGAAQAAAELSQSLMVAMTCDTVERARAVMTQVRSEWAKFGAMDSEPRRVVEAYLDVAFSPAEERIHKICREGYSVPFV